MRRIAIASVLGIGLLLLDSTSAFSEKAKPIETFTAFGVHMGTGGASVITMTIERWSTDAERQALLVTLRDKGQAELIAALKKMPRVGFIRLPNTRGYDLKYARSTENPDGTRHVVVASDRVLRFREVASSSRSRNYDFALAEMHLDKSGVGEGKLAPATLIAIDKEKNQLEIESYGAQPVRLMKVTAKKP